MNVAQIGFPCRLDQYSWFTKHLLQGSTLCVHIEVCVNVAQIGIPKKIKKECMHGSTLFMHIEVCLNVAQIGSTGRISIHGLQNTYCMSPPFVCS